jgi:hypothetical protein
VAKDLHQLSWGTTNRSSIATTCTSIGPHPLLLTLGTSILSIPKGGLKCNIPENPNKTWQKKFLKTRFCLIAGRDFDTSKMHKLLVCLSEVSYMTRTTTRMSTRMHVYLQSMTIAQTSREIT